MVRALTRARCLLFPLAFLVACVLPSHFARLASRTAVLPGGPSATPRRRVHDTPDSRIIRKQMCAQVPYCAGPGSQRVNRAVVQAHMRIAASTGPGPDAPAVRVSPLSASFALRIHCHDLRFRAALVAAGWAANGKVYACDASRVSIDEVWLSLQLSPSIFAHSVRGVRL
ncbi:hypothetical protein HYPSUDRAFT_210462 [Hypholoma sublateritium FD-334 SS-4]|uniref:Uncharacterized protein n=1 Tax=Hypholoma sublateritium (strain FD-334 SS-4) TaxID=945553 RepID=A0A0D2MZW4_HYPSF|nr:hypothetical protein HYPSUDRAFT_210462 [Hypholoma sublateritium FD-334 SS-4]